MSQMFFMDGKAEYSHSLESSYFPGLRISSPGF